MPNKNLPEIVKEEKTQPETVFLRTILKKEVHVRLRDIAQAYSTGQGHWDFGVAIQILLDHFDESQLAIQSDKLDMIIGLIQSKEEPATEPEDDSKTHLEMLGGSKIKRKE